MESILKFVRKAIGPSDAYEHFDPELIVFVNSAFSRLSQLGVGPEEGFAIKDDTAVWSDYIANDKRLEDVKEYIYLKVKVVFDPPASQAVLSHFNQRIVDLEWQLNAKVD